MFKCDHLKCSQYLRLLHRFEWFDHSKQWNREEYKKTVVASFKAQSQHFPMKTRHGIWCLSKKKKKNRNFCKAIRSGYYSNQPPRLGESCHCVEHVSDPAQSTVRWSEMAMFSGKNWVRFWDRGPDISVYLNNIFVWTWHCRDRASSYNIYM